tara:strand:- start:5790 stop:6038 length:249 start_codon:yes stop_codon:yes gene_type:complete
MIKHKLKKRYSNDLQDQFKIEVSDADANNIYRFSTPSEERNDANSLYVEIEGPLNDTLNHDEPINPMTKEEIENWLDAKEAE